MDKWTVNTPLFLCFIDYKKTFDSVPHDQLWLVMLEMGFPAHIVQLISKLYCKQEAVVRIDKHVTSWFNIWRGVRQGCIISPYLFNIYAEKVTREALEGVELGFRIEGRIVNNLRYADDVVLIATSESDLQELVDRVSTASVKASLSLNTEKTKVMMLSKDRMGEVQCNLSNIWKSLDITNDTKVRLNEKSHLAHCFIYGCEGWILKKAD